MDEKDGCKAGGWCYIWSGKFLFIKEKSGNLCGKHANSEGLVEVKENKHTKGQKQNLYSYFFPLIFIPFKQAGYDFIDTVESRKLFVLKVESCLSRIYSVPLSVSLTVRYSWIQLCINQCGVNRL